MIRNFRITASDGKSYDTRHYSLAAIIAVGYKVNSERAVQFRKWAITVIESFTIKGFAMDDERLKNDGSILTRQYFEEQLQRIREIRLSERKFYQKITDIYATAIDYDITAQATKRFFSSVQNKLHWAIHGQTAAEAISCRTGCSKATSIACCCSQGQAARSLRTRPLRQAHAANCCAWWRRWSSMKLWMK